MTGAEHNPDDTIRITNAAEAYDGFGTTTLETFTRTDRYGREITWRRVQMLPEHMAWQIGRYQSGMHPAFTLTQWEELKDIL